MKNTTLLKKLQKIEKNASMNLDSDFIALLTEVKQEVYNETKGFTSSQKQASKKALNFLKKLQKGARPVLGYCDFQEIHGEKYQVFTDSYTLIALKTFYELPTVEDFKKLDSKNKEATYPSVHRIVPYVHNGEKAKNNLDTLLKKLKSGMYEKGQKIDSIESKSYKANFDIKRLKEAVEMLGTMDLDIYLFGNTKPAMFVDSETGNFTIICPLRNYE